MLFKAIRLTVEVCGAHWSAEAIQYVIQEHLWIYPDEYILDGLKRCRNELKPERGFVVFNLAILLEKMPPLPRKPVSKIYDEQLEQETGKFLDPLPKSEL